MHPAPSVIVFSTFSGAGFGYLAILGVTDAAGTGWPAFLRFTLGYAFAVGGLIASTLHLGNPQRALLAFTQWKTSWLSREAWLSVGALVLMGVFAAAAVVFGATLRSAGVAGALLSVATIGSTAMIYAQLKTVPRWNTNLTPAYFLVAGLTGGALMAGMTAVAVVLLIALALVQVLTWLRGDRRFAARGHTIETATRLGGPGKPVRLLEGPHTGRNYLLDEFVHEVGRRHALKLRWITLAAMCALPIVLLVLLPATGIAIALALASHMGGVLVSRWLFFAEAEHVVKLYYGR